MNPSISIISISFNNKVGLKKTIQSVLEQTFCAYELIVIDGGSNDGTKEMLESYRDKISYWVSEKDNGIYNAMNKGVLAAKGEYLLMLNSGDFLLDSTVLENVSKHLDNHKQIVYGDVIWRANQDSFYGSFPSNPTFDYFIKHSLGHQAAFIHRNVHHVVGLYDEDLKIVADWELFILAFCKHNLSFKHVDLAISECSRDGLSCLPESLPIIEKEKAVVLQHYFPLFIEDYKKKDLLVEEIRLIKQSLHYRIISKIKRTFNK